MGSWVVGILTSEGILMIGNWRKWRAFPEIASFGGEKISGGCFELERK